LTVYVFPLAYGNASTGQ